MSLFFLFKWRTYGNFSAASELFLSLILTHCDFLFTKLITVNNWEVLEESYLACFLMPCVPWTLLSAPLCSATSTIGIWHGAGSPEGTVCLCGCQSLLGTARLGSGCVPLSLTCQSNLLGPPQGSADRSLHPDSRTWASIRTRGKWRTDRDRGASRSPRGGGPHLHANPTHPPLNQTVSPGPLTQTLDHLSTPGSVDAGASERDKGLK